MSVRVIVHAGFHKTGTSSLQTYLGSHRALLSPYFNYYGKMQFLQAGAAGRIYGQRPFPWRLWRFRQLFRAFLTTVQPARVIVLSRETFSGIMPGHKRFLGGQVTDFQSAAIPLARTITSELKRRFGPETEIIFLYTLRARMPWITSAYGHLLRSIRLTKDLDPFVAQFPATFDLGREAQVIRDAIKPIQVRTSWLEDSARHRLGPATPLLEAAQVPSWVIDELPGAERINTGHSAALLQEFLRMNREMSNRQALKAAKEALAAEERAARNV